MPLASNDERTATVGLTRPQEHRVSPFQGSERLMTLVEVSQLLGVPIATLYGQRVQTAAEQRSHLLACHRVSCGQAVDPVHAGADPHPGVSPRSV